MTVEEIGGSRERLAASLGDGAGPDAGSPTRRARRPGPWWRGDRLSGWSALLLMPVSLGIASYGLISEFDLWRFELPRAVDRAGLYLFFVCPLLSGLCAWNAQRRVKDLRGLTDGLARLDLIARSSWMPLAAVALAIHVLVVLCHVGVALVSRATGQVPWLALLTEFLCVCAFCVFGALCGGRLPGRLTAPLIFLGLLAANTLLAQYGFRRISEVGTGAADFVDLSYAPGYLLPKVALFTAVLVLGLPLRGLRVPTIFTIVDGLALTLGTCAVVVLMLYSGPMLRMSPEPRDCTGAAPTVCIPRSMHVYQPQLVAAVDVAVDQLRGRGVADIPGRISVISRATVEVPHGTAGLLVSSATFHDAKALRREVARGLSSAQMCDDMRAVSGPPDNVLVARASLDGWIQVHTDAVEPGTFPPEAVAALDEGSAAERSGALRSLFTAVWTCSRSVRPPA